MMQGCGDGVAGRERGTLLRACNVICARGAHGDPQDFRSATSEGGPHGIGCAADLAEPCRCLLCVLSLTAFFRCSVVVCLVKARE